MSPVRSSTRRYSLKQSSELSSYKKATIFPSSTRVSAFPVLASAPGIIAGLNPLSSSSALEHAPNATENMQRAKNSAGVVLSENELTLLMLGSLDLEYFFCIVSD